MQALGRVNVHGAISTFLSSSYAPLLTHLLLTSLVAALFFLLLVGPVWVMFLPAAMIQHRIGILLHEYVHGIPFRKRSSNIAVLVWLDGLLLGFGITEFFRVAHIHHHRWMNTDRDPGFVRDWETESWFGQFEAVQYLFYFRRLLLLRPDGFSISRIVTGVGLSFGWATLWGLVGRVDIPVELFVLTLANTAVSTSLRAAIEHSGPPGSNAFANDYQVLFPLLNVNKHIHHHEDPGCPWYRLEFRSSPLPIVAYFSHWFGIHIKGRIAPFRGTGSEGSIRD